MGHRERVVTAIIKQHGAATSLDEAKNFGQVAGRESNRGVNPKYTGVLLKYFLDTETEIMINKTTNSARAVLTCERSALED